MIFFFQIEVYADIHCCEEFVATYLLEHLATNYIECMRIRKNDILRNMIERIPMNYLINF